MLWQRDNTGVIFHYLEHVSLILHAKRTNGLRRSRSPHPPFHIIHSNDLHVSEFRTVASGTVLSSCMLSIISMKKAETASGRADNWRHFSWIVTRWYTLGRPQWKKMHRSLLKFYSSMRQPRLVVFISSKLIHLFIHCPYSDEFLYRFFQRFVAPLFNFF